MKKKQINLRYCENFDPSKFIKEGLTEEGEKFTYLPAYARVLWFNTYKTEKDLKWGLIAQRITNENDEKVVYHSEVIDYSNGTPFVISTGDGSVIKGPFAHEKAETRAKARCLASLGFSVREEESQLFDEGETPVDGPIDCTKHQEQETKSSKKVKEKEKTTEDSKDNEDSQFSFDLPSIVDDGDEDEKMLRKCLNAYFPYQPYKGEKVIDIFIEPGHNPATLIDKINWLKDQDFGKRVIDADLTINEWTGIMARYLINPDTEDKKTFLNLVTKMSKEKNEENV